MLRPVPCILAAMFCCSAFALRAADEPDYVRDIKPILAANCFSCHGPKKQESELRLDSGAAILAGGNTGPAVVPGKPEKSLLLAALRGTSDDVSRMPPKDEAEPLPAEKIALLERWIAAGAKFPSDDAPIAPKITKSDHWSFQPIACVNPPQVQDTNWPQNGIDAFILARLEAEKVSPAPSADKATLLRRVTLDLTGLPPTPEELERFQADSDPLAYERVVDRLLASPRYGERWGRQWLDLARYADSQGYTNDAPRTIWKYRDWVIDAVNRDLPFDQFTIQQLAGDLLPDATVEQKVATGFHRNTQFNDEGGSDAEQYRVEAVVDRVSTTGVVFLGLTVGCARCHDHKFDPVSQRNFYELFAFLNNQDEPNLSIPLLPPEQSKLPAAKAEVAELTRQLKALDDKSPELASLTAKLAAARKRETEIRTAEQVTTPVLSEKKSPRDSYVHIRGEFLRPGKRVYPAVPEFLPAIPPPTSASAESPPSYNRLDLARWIVSPENPLTARVTVNRHWQAFFGKGLVLTENDFGRQGEKPSHPELLDWLARRLMENGWSIKALHREIVLSATYRQASHARPELHARDPLNRWLARQNRLRLEAELIRDAALVAAGLLSSKMHGPSVFPPQPAGVMERTRNPGRGWKTSVGEDRYRRGLYTYFWRSTPHPFLKSFDAPEGNTACTRRDRSNTPVQALTLLNDEAFVEASQRLALRVLRDESIKTDDERLTRLFAWCLSRQPNDAELAALRELLAEELKVAKTVSATSTKLAFLPEKELPAGVDLPTATAWVTLARTMLNLDEFITRE